MPNRREFLRTGAAVSAVAANGAIARAAEAVGARPPIALGRALYDDRYAEGCRFAAVVTAQGVPTHALDNGDITPFYGELVQLWHGDPIAGFTQAGPLLVVERLALERGMRLVMRVEHGTAGDGALAHRFTGPRGTLDLAAGFEALHSDWPGLMAALACRVGSDDSPPCTSELVTPGLARPSLPPGARLPSFVHYYTPHAEQQGHGPALDGPLYSWVVAPRA